MRNTGVRERFFHPGLILKSLAPERRVDPWRDQCSFPATYAFTGEDDSRSSATRCVSIKANPTARRPVTTPKDASVSSPLCGAREAYRNSWGEIAIGKPCAM